METPQEDDQPAQEDDQPAQPALTATERAFAEIERRSRAMVEGMLHFGGA